MRYAWKWLLVLFGVGLPLAGVVAEEFEPWRGTRLAGSPEPPLPYTTEPTWQEVTWEKPIYAKAEPGTSRLFVVLQGGEADRPSRIVSVDEAQGATPQELLSLPERLIYGLAFDPQYEQNGYLYVFSNGPTPEPERTNRISRWTVQRNPNGTVTPDSELILIAWRSMGHDGGELGFGRDGMLYISSGDGTSDSDRWFSAQDVTNLLGAVLRIDVRDASPSTPYRIPADNPFRHLPDARGELWAIGLRNPWRLWCDLASGQVWVGNNGQDLWETVHLIRRGENYGWSVYEGSHPFYPNRERGPAPIVRPTVEHHHTEARSLTGGLVYRGSRLPELVGAYVYGDYSTGRIWAVRHDGKQVTWHQELADTTLQIAGFAQSPAGQLLIVDHGGGLHQLVPNTREDAASAEAFPRRLSETELFASVRDHRLAAGVVSYSVNASAWHDGAEAERFLAVPAGEVIRPQTRRGWNFPNGSVLGQTLSRQGRRLETRLMVRWQNEWAGYSYRWDQQGEDAELVETGGAELTVEGEAWHVPSRAECLSCHSRAVNFVLGMNDWQLARHHGESNELQWEQWHAWGLLEETPEVPASVLVDPYDPEVDLTARARSYLHVNCSSCHVEAGGGNARMELEWDREQEAMNLVGARPQHATFSLSNAMLVAPGDPDRSVLMQRLRRRGAGQMPPIFSRRVDTDALELVGRWIESMPAPKVPFVREWTTEAVHSVWDNRGRAESSPEGQKLFAELGCRQCHRIHGDGGGAGPDLSTVGERLSPRALAEALVEPSAKIDPRYATTFLTTEDGQALQGYVEFEDEDQLRLRSAESFDAPIVVRKSAIEARGLSAVSSMPSGILNRCTEQQVLQLLGFLLSGRTDAESVSGED